MSCIEVITRGVIQHENQFLLAHDPSASNTYLPGGHVDFGESLTDALRREMLEEIGYEAQVHAYLGAVENVYQRKGTMQHEVNHIFLCKVPGISPENPVLSCEKHLEFFWVKANRLSEVNLLPSPVIDLMQRYLSGEHRTWWASTIR